MPYLDEAAHWREEGDLVQARRVLARAVTVAQSARTVDRLAVRTARRMLAEVLREAGDVPAAYRISFELSAECDRDLGPRHPATVRARAVLARVVHDLGEFDRAEALYQQVIEAGPGGPAGRAVSLTQANLALLHGDRGDLQLARIQLAATYLRHRRAYGLDVDTVRIGVELAGLHQAAGDLAAARRVLSVAYVACCARLGEQHPLTRSVDHQLAAIEPPIPNAATEPPTVPAGRVHRRMRQYRPPARRAGPASRARRLRPGSRPSGGWRSLAFLRSLRRQGAAPRPRRVIVEHRAPRSTPAGPPAVAPAPSPGAPRTRTRTRTAIGLAVAALAVVLGAAIAVAVGVVGDAPGSGPARIEGSATPQPSAATAAPVGAMPLVLGLRDQGVSLTVSWNTGAPPVVVALATAGRPPTVVARLPAGTDRYTLDRLDAGLEYCVIVGPDEDTAALSPASSVCTARRSGGVRVPPGPRRPSGAGGAGRRAI
jgi:hypothetical protein